MYISEKAESKQKLCDDIQCVVLMLHRKLLFGRTSCFFFQAEDGIRDLVRSRGLGDVYKRQDQRVIAVARGVDKGRAHAGDVEDGFDKKRAGQQLSLIHI